MLEDPSVRLPTIYVTARDRSRLHALLARRGRSVPEPIRASLERELARAVVCAENAVPDDVVTMNARALFRADVGAEPQSRTLIYDDDYAILGGTVSVLTAAGAALLGLRAGSRMPYINIDGERRVLILDRVAYQPEAHGRIDADPYRRWPPTTGAGGTVVALPLRKTPARREPPPDDPGPDAA